MVEVLEIWFVMIFLVENKYVMKKKYIYLFYLEFLIVS